MSYEVKHPRLAPPCIEEAVKESRRKRNVVVVEDDYDPIEESKRVEGQLVKRDPEVEQDLLKERGDREIQATSLLVEVRR